MGIIKDLFGNFTDPVSGETLPVYRYKLTQGSQDADGIEVHLLSYGAGICGILAPDKKGVKENVVLGFSSMEGYLANPFQGSTIGRVTNRIKGGMFSLEGQHYQLTINDNQNHIHGGTRGWDKRVWSSSESEDAVVFSLVSSDGDQGYPGTVMAQVRYRLPEPGYLQVEFTALTSAPSPVNMTNHAYFNLAGHASGRKQMIRHTCELKCDRYLPVMADHIPTGEQCPVEGTGFDLRTAKTFGSAMSSVEGGGFDHCFVLEDANRGTLRPAAIIEHPPSGRALTVLTTEPGIQFYTGNFLPEKPGTMVGRGDVSYTKQCAFACEPQNLPDAVNHEGFPNCILKPGEFYKHTMVYKFTRKVDS